MNSKLKNYLRCEYEMSLLNKLDQEFLETDPASLDQVQNRIIAKAIAKAAIKKAKETCQIKRALEIQKRIDDIDLMIDGVLDTDELNDINPLIYLYNTCLQMNAYVETSNNENDTLAVYPKSSDDKLLVVDRSGAFCYCDSFKVISTNKDVQFALTSEKTRIESINDLEKVVRVKVCSAKLGEIVAEPDLILTGRGLIPDYKELTILDDAYWELFGYLKNIGTSFEYEIIKSNNEEEMMRGIYNISSKSKILPGSYIVTNNTRKTIGIRYRYSSVDQFIDFSVCPESKIHLDLETGSELIVDRGGLIVKKEY